MIITFYKREVDKVIQISRHAEKRLRERNGLNKKSMQRIAERAFNNGLEHRDTTGNLRKWLLSLKDKRNNVNKIMIYGHQVYLFAGNILVTVFDVPGNLRKNVDIAKEKLHN